MNEDEPPMRCAAREVFEETGFDPTDLIDHHSYLCHPINDSLVQLYIGRFG